MGTVILIIVLTPSLWLKFRHVPARRSSASRGQISKTAPRMPRSANSSANAASRPCRYCFHSRRERRRGMKHLARSHLWQRHSHLALTNAPSSHQRGFLTHWTNSFATSGQGPTPLKGGGPLSVQSLSGHVQKLVRFLVRFSRKSLYYPNFPGFSSDASGVSKLLYCAPERTHARIVAVGQAQLVRIAVSPP